MKKRFGIGKKIILILLALLAVLVICFFTIKVNHVTIEGNTQVSDEDVAKYIFSDRFGMNSMWIYAKEKMNKHVEIPYVEKYSITFSSLSDVTVHIQEKVLVGYIEYMGNLTYFDKDGMVIASRKKKIDGIPQITGLNFSTVVVNEKLPTKNSKLFERILNITKLINQYQLPVSKIKMDENGSIVLSMKKAKIKLGNDEHLDEKVSCLNDMQSILKDKKGTLDMEVYNESGEYVFKKSK